MSLLADLEGSLTLNVDGFISAANSAESVWGKVSSAIIDAGNHLNDILGKEFVDSSDKAAQAMQGVGAAVSEVPSDLNVLRQSVQASADDFAVFGTSLQSSLIGLEGVSDKVGQGVPAFDDLNKTVSDSTGVFASFQGILDDGAQLLSGVGNAIAGLLPDFLNLTGEVDSTSKSIYGLEDSLAFDSAPFVDAVTKIDTASADLQKTNDNTVASFKIFEDNLSIDTAPFVNSQNSIESALGDVKTSLEDASKSFDIFGGSLDLDAAPFISDIHSIEAAAATVNNSLDDAAKGFGNLESSLNIDITPFADAAKESESVWSSAVDAIMSGAMALVDLLAGPFTDSAEKAGEAIQTAGEHASGSAPHFNELKESINETTESMRGLLEKLGLALGTFEVLKESFEAFSQFQNLTTSFELLSKSSDVASESIENLIHLSDKLGVSTSDLFQTAQKMAPQFGVGTKLMIDSLTAAADAAAVTGRSLDGVANSLERVMLTGQVSARQLVQLGLSWKDIAATMSDVMGRTISVSDAQLLLKKGAQDATVAVEILGQTLKDKYGGAAEQVAQNISGQFQELKNQLHELALAIGKDLAPLASDLMAIAKNDIIPFVRSLVDAFTALPTPIQETILAVTGLVAAFKLLNVVGLVGSITELSATALLASPALIAIGAAIAGWAIYEAVTKLKELDDQLESTRRKFELNGAASKSEADEINKLTSILDTHNKELGATQVNVSAVGLSTSEYIQNLRSAVVEIGKTDKVQGDLTATFKDGVYVFGEAKKETDLVISSLALLNDAFEKLGIKTPPTTEEILKLKNAFGTLSSAFSSGVISQFAYIEAAKGLNTELSKVEDTGLNFSNVLKSIGTTAFIDALSKMGGSAADFASVLDVVQAKFAVGKASIQDYAAAMAASIASSKPFEDAITKQDDAISGLNSKFLNLIPTMASVENLIKSFGKDSFDTITANLNALQKKIDDAFSAMAVDAPRAALAIQLAVEALNKEFDKLGQTGEGDIEKLKTQFLNAENTMQQGIEGWDPIFGWTGTIKDASGALKNFTDALPATNDALNKQSEYIASLNQDWGKWGTVLIDTQKVLNDLGVRSVGQLNASLKDAKTNLDITTDAFKKGQTSAQAVTIAWQAVHDIEVKLKQDKLDLQSLGVPDIEELGRRVDDDNDALKRLANDGYKSVTQATEANITATRDQIALDFQAGKDTSELQSKLESLTDSLKRQKEGWFALSQELQHVQLSDLKSTFHDMIFDVGKLGDDFKKLGEDMVDTVMNHIIERAMKPLLKALDDVIARAVEAGLKLVGLGSGAGGGTGVLGTAVGAATGGTKIPSIPIPSTGIPGIPGGGAGTGGIPGMPQQTIGDIPTLPPPGADVPLGAATSGLSSAMNSFSSALTGFVGPISQAVSAVTGVISVFQNMHQETSLNAIELNTRITSILLGSIDETGKAPQDADNLKTWTKTIGMTLVSHLPSMRTALDMVNATTQNMRQDTYGILTNMTSLLQEAILDLQVIMLGATAGNNQTGGGSVTLAQIQLLSDATRNSNNTVQDSFHELEVAIGLLGNTLSQAIKDAALDPSKLLDKFDHLEAELKLDLDKLGKDIDHSLNPLGTFGTILNSISGGLSSIFGGVGSGLGSAIGSIGTGLAGGLGSLGGTIVDALTGGGRQEGTLNGIELNTRITSILLGSIDATGKAPQDADNLKGWTKTTGMTVQDIDHFNWSVLHPDLVGIWSTLGDIAAKLLVPSSSGPEAAVTTPVDFDALFEGVRVELLDLQNSLVEAIAETKLALYSPIHSDLVDIFNALANTTVQTTGSATIATPISQAALLAPASVVIDYTEFLQKLIVVTQSLLTQIHNDLVVKVPEIAAPLVSSPTSTIALAANTVEPATETKPAIVETLLPAMQQCVAVIQSGFNELTGIVEQVNSSINKLVAVTEQKLTSPTLVPLSSTSLGLGDPLAHALSALPAIPEAAVTPTTTAISEQFDFKAPLETLRIELLDVQNGIIAAVSDVKQTLFNIIHTDLVGIWTELAKPVNADTPRLAVEATSPLITNVDTLPVLQKLVDITQNLLTQIHNDIVAKFEHINDVTKIILAPEASAPSVPVLGAASSNEPASPPEVASVPFSLAPLTVAVEKALAIIQSGFSDVIAVGTQINSSLGTIVDSIRKIKLEQAPTPTESNATVQVEHIPSVSSPTPAPVEPLLFDFKFPFENLRIALLDVQNGVSAAVSDVNQTLYNPIHNDLIELIGSIKNIGVSPSAQIDYSYFAKLLEVQQSYLPQILDVLKSLALQDQPIGVPTKLEPVTNQGSDVTYWQQLLDIEKTNAALVTNLVHSFDHVHVDVQELLKMDVTRTEKLFTGLSNIAAVLKPISNLSVPQLETNERLRSIDSLTSRGLTQLTRIAEEKMTPITLLVDGQPLKAWMISAFEHSAPVS